VTLVLSGLLAANASAGSLLASAGCTGSDPVLSPSDASADAFAQETSSGDAFAQETSSGGDGGPMLSCESATSLVKNGCFETILDPWYEYQATMAAIVNDGVQGQGAVRVMTDGGTDLGIQQDLGMLTPAAGSCLRGSFSFKLASPGAPLTVDFSFYELQGQRFLVLRAGATNAWTTSNILCRPSGTVGWTSMKVSLDIRTPGTVLFDNAALEIVPCTGNEMACPDTP
jgi:hypothetical protein